MLENIKKCGYEVPTPVQAYCLPAVFTNNDIIAVAQTGEADSSLGMREITDRLQPRIWENCCFPYSDHLKINGEGKEACCSSPGCWPWL